MIIIGITGTIGAGKGTIVSYLIDRHDFEHYSVRKFLVDEILERGLIVNRDNMVAIANELRAKHTPSFIAEQLYEKARSAGKNCIIESLRTIGEVSALQAKGNFYLFAVDADPRFRFDRIKNRKSETDDIDFQTFLENEKREMTSDDPNKQNIAACIALADYRFENNGDFENLYNQIENTLTEITHKTENQ